MKIIRIEGCVGCPYVDNRGYTFGDYCKKTLKFLDKTWDVNPYYLHPDCPLEDEEKKDA